MKSFLVILKYIQPYKKYAIINIVFTILSTIFGLVSLTMLIPFIQVLFNPDKLIMEPVAWDITSMDALLHNFNYQVSKITIDKGTTYALGFISIVVLVSSLFKNGFSYAGSYFMAPIMNGSVRDFQRKIYKKILNLPLRYFTDEKKGDLISRFTSDVQEIKFTLTGSVDMLFKDPIMLMFYLGYLIYLSPSLTVIVFVLLPLIALLIGKIGKSLKRKSHEGQAKMGELLAIFEETLSGLRIIKAFCAENKINERFKNLNSKIYRIMNHLTRKNSLSSPLSEFLGTIVVVLVLVIGGSIALSEDSNFSSAKFIAYLAAFSQIINPAKSLSKTYYVIQRGLASIDRVNKILDEKMHISIAAKPKKISLFNTSIEFKNVSFKYKDDYVLKNINLKIEKGKTVALVGQSGSGKSTLVDLIPRFYDIEEGEILIDGININEYNLEHLRRLIGFVNQEPILFNETIASNIAFGLDNINLEEVKKAAIVANADEFIQEKPSKYQFNIGDRGTKLSGGQRQRLSIARAVYKNPPIMILDEATSALDTESEKLVQDALFKLMENRTSIVIAHRLSTVRDADEICVLQHGEIKERGKHTELYEENGIYKKLCDLQMM